MTIGSTCVKDKCRLQVSFLGEVQDANEQPSSMLQNFVNFAFVSIAFGAWLLPVDHRNCRNWMTWEDPAPMWASHLSKLCWPRLKRKECQNWSNAKPWRKPPGLISMAWATMGLCLSSALAPPQTMTASRCGWPIHFLCWLVVSSKEEDGPVCSKRSIPSSLPVFPNLGIYCSMQMRSSLEMHWPIDKNVRLGPYMVVSASSKTTWSMKTAGLWSPLPGLQRSTKSVVALAKCFPKPWNAHSWIQRQTPDWACFFLTTAMPTKTLL